LFHNANLFGSCIIHILYTECAEIKQKIIPAPKGSYSKILHGDRFALRVLYGSENRQRPLLYTSLTGWFL